MSRPNPQLNGQLLYIPGRPEIYWIDRGLTRHIPDEATYQGVFGASPNKKVYKELLSEVEAGPPIAHGAELVRAGNDPKIYFVENKIKRWIPSEAIKAKFQLNGDVHSLPLATVHALVSGPEFVDPAPVHAPVEPGPRPQPIDPLPRPINPHPLPIDPLPSHAPGSGTQTLNSNLGPISWVESPVGTIHAEADGLKLLMTGTSKPDVSGESHLEYSSKDGKPYLSMNFTWNQPEKKTVFSISGGSSHLTVALSNIDAATKSGTFLLLGVWDGKTVSQTSRVDLSLDVRSYGPVTGWPPSAFKAELEKVAIFNPLSFLLAKTFVAKHTASRTGSGTAVSREKTAGGFFGRAGAGCILAGLGGFVLGGPAGAAIGCLVAADTSMAADDITMLTDDRPASPPSNPPANPPTNQPVDPPTTPVVDPTPITDPPADPPVGPPADPDPSGPVSYPGDPVPDPSGPVSFPGDGLDDPGGGGGGGGGHHPIDSGDPTLEED